jgi:hypothetical protein
MIATESILIALTVVLAIVLRRFVPRMLVMVMTVGLTIVAALIAVLTWLDLDKLAVLFGPLLSQLAVYGTTFLMWDAIIAYPALAAVLQSFPGNSSVMSKSNRGAVITGLVVLLLLVSVGALIGSIQLFQLFEYLFDDGLPS